MVLGTELVFADFSAARLGVAAVPWPCCLTARLRSRGLAPQVAREARSRKLALSAAYILIALAFGA